MAKFRRHTAQSYPRKLLTRRELYVLRERKNRTLKSVGDSIGVSTNRVRQIHGKATRKLLNFPDENRAYLRLLPALENR